MKKLIVLLLGVIFLSGCEPEPYGTYRVVITYCNDRSKDTVLVYSKTYPYNGLIETYRQAVPKWNGYLNVCNIETLEKL